MLRMSVAGGGCAGLQYYLGFDTAFDPELDARYEQHGVAVVAGRRSPAPGRHHDRLPRRSDGRGFAIDNPSVPRGGGCPGCGHH